jgi:hypothetical protein
LEGVTQATGTGGGAGVIFFATNDELVQAIYRVSAIYIFFFE